MQDTPPVKLRRFPFVIGIMLSMMVVLSAVKAESTATLSLDANTTAGKLPALALDDSPLVTTSSLTTASGILIADAPIYWGNVSSRGGYTLQQVINIAWRQNPTWAKFSASHMAAHAALLEACALPNPEIEGDIGRESSRAGDGSRTAWSLAFSQPIEMPGKRRARQAEALAGFPVVQQEAAEFGNTLRANVCEAYWIVQYHTALEQMHQGQVTITTQQYELAQKRLELGDAGRIELLNARVEKLKAQREYNIARRRHLGSMAALNALCGGALGSNFNLATSFPVRYAQPNLDQAVQKALSQHPRLAVLAAQLEEKHAGIERQRREWWPDVRIGARHSQELDTRSNALTAGIEIPLFNRNEGGIARAQAEAQRVYAEVTIAYNELRRDVEQAYQSLLSAREEMASYDNGLRSAAEEAVRLSWEQLSLGGGDHLEILMARRQLLEIQQGYIQSLYDAAMAKTQFDRAVGQP